MIPYEELCIALAQWRGRQGKDPGYATGASMTATAVAAAPGWRRAAPAVAEEADTGYSPPDPDDSFVEDVATSMVQAPRMPDYDQDEGYASRDLAEDQEHVVDADSGMVMAALEDDVGEATGMTQVAPAPDGDEPDDLAPPPAPMAMGSLTDFGMVGDQEVEDDGYAVVDEQTVVAPDDDTGEIDPDQIEEVAPWRETDDK